MWCQGQAVASIDATSTAGPVRVTFNGPCCASCIDKLRLDPRWTVQVDPLARKGRGFSDQNGNPLIDDL